MRKFFSKALEEQGNNDEKIFFLTGDLGFHAFENLVSSLEGRYINAGVAEQNMLGVAAGLAYTGFQPWVYSIAPFITLKTTEQIRNDLCHTNIPVKLVGNGGGYGYGIMGSTHHVVEDIAILSSFQNMRIYCPAFNEDVFDIVNKTNQEISPAYLRLGMAPETTISLPKYSPTRKIFDGDKVTLIAFGPLIHKALEAIEKLGKNNLIDLWTITELPLDLPEKIFDSIKTTKKLIIVEENVKSGGIGEKILSTLVDKKILVDKVIHLYARGYLSKLYGSQEFHLKENILDSKGIFKNIKMLL